MGRQLRLLKSYGTGLVLVLLLALLQSIANLALPTLMANIVDYGIVKSDTGYPVTTRLNRHCTRENVICATTG